MCGITGFVDFEMRGSPEDLKRATARLHHRGPDGERTWLSSGGIFGLGHARLAIIDLELGQQPMFSVDGRFAIAFNGEIYNFKSLRAELEALGYAFRTHSDTEVILCAFAEWGEGCASRLHGMFAFAIVDTREERIFLCRDRTGIKPLYYHHASSVLRFGSELNAVMEYGGVPRRLRRETLVDFLVLGFPLGPETFFVDCCEVEPGSWIEFSRDGLRRSRYWRWSYEPVEISKKDALATLEEKLISSLKDHLVSDVPIGAFLSGGIDSSLAVALLAKHLNHDLQTFTVRFGDRADDESEYARAVAEHTGVRQVVIDIPTDSANFSLVEEIIDRFDQPFGDSSAIPTFLVCNEIRKHVKVAIGGDGGDEMFGGYERFRYAEMAREISRAPKWLSRAAQHSVALMSPIAPDRTRALSRLFAAAEKSADDRLVSISAFTQPTQLPSVLQPEFRRSLGEYQTRFAGFSGNGHGPGGGELVDATIEYVLAADYLRKVDTMSSAHGLEVRVPFLGDQILGFASRLPRNRSYSLWSNKILLKKLAAKYLPEKVVRRKKHGFGLSLDTWFGLRGRKRVADILHDPQAQWRQFISPSYMSTLLESFVAQSWDHRTISRYGLYQRVYCLWALERWLQKWRPTV